jgi:hypothetical protein
VAGDVSGGDAEKWKGEKERVLVVLKDTAHFYVVAF